MITYPKYPDLPVYVYINDDGESWIEFMGPPSMQIASFPFDSNASAYLKMEFPEDHDDPCKIFNITNQDLFLAHNLPFIKNQSAEMLNYMWHR